MREVDSSGSEGRSAAAGLMSTTGSACCSKIRVFSVIAHTASRFSCGLALTAQCYLEGLGIKHRLGQQSFLLGVLPFKLLQPLGV